MKKLFAMVLVLMMLMASAAHADGDKLIVGASCDFPP